MCIQGCRKVALRLASLDAQYRLCRLLLIDACDAYAIPALLFGGIQRAVGGSDEHRRVAALSGLRCSDTDANRDDGLSCNRQALCQRQHQRGSDASYSLADHVHRDSRIT
jgi:hypothetical protein